MLLLIFLFAQIFYIQVLNGQNSFMNTDVPPKIVYILDASVPTLHFDLSILEPNQKLIIATSTHFSLDMFLGGLYPTELKNYLFYESDSPSNENYVGSLADEELFEGNKTTWYIPLLYSAKSKALTITKTNETATITNSVLFFRIHEVHKCGTHKNVAQPSSKEYTYVEYSISAPNDAICQFTVITYKQRPRRLVIQYLETNSTEAILISGSTFNKSLDYFQFNKYIADDFSNLNLFGSVFTFNIPKSEKIIVSFAGQKDYDHADLNQQPASLDALNVITSPDYGELNPFATLKYCKEEICKMTIKNYNKNSWFLFQILNRDNISNSTTFFAIDGEDQRYDLKILSVQTSNWIRATNFTIFYSDNQLSNFRITYQLYPTGNSYLTSSSSMSSENTVISPSTTIAATTKSNDSTINKNFNIFILLIFFVIHNL